MARAASGEAGFTGSSDGVRALSDTRMEPARQEAIRSRFESSEVAQGRFRPLGESQLPKGQSVVTAHQHGTNDSGGFLKETPLSERRRKAGQREHSRREGHDVWAGHVKTFRNAGDVEKGTAGL